MKRLVIVFLKWPEPGQVKTRLARDVGDAEAAAIYRELTAAVGRQLAACQGEDLAVCYAPADRATELEAWISREVFPSRPVHHWWAQPEGDLGERQAWAFERAAEVGYERMAVVGTDCIDLSARLMSEAWDGLDQAGWVFGPARDGGYYLAATKVGALSGRKVFGGVRWSSCHALEDCLRNLETGGARHVLLETILDDVDDFEDWNCVRDRL